jgi:uncharacterized protein
MSAHAQPAVLVGVRFEPAARAHVLLLQEEEQQQRILPIFIGNAEAEALTFALEQVTTPRPLTHELLLTLLEELGGTLRSVHISDLRDHTFFAELNVDIGGAPHTISARPSDSVVLAARIGCPLLIAEHVLNMAGQIPEPVATVPEELVEEFQAFIDTVSPEDFAS